MSTVTHLMSSKLNDFSSPPSDSRCDLRRLLSAKPSCFLLLPFAPSPRLLITAAMGQPLHSQPIRLSFFKELNIFRRWLVEVSRFFGLGWSRQVRIPNPMFDWLIDCSAQLIIFTVYHGRFQSRDCSHAGPPSPPSHVCAAL